MKIVIATIKSWNIENANSFITQYGDEFEFRLITNKDELTVDFLKSFKPDYVFFPHWSYIIPKEIFDSYNCVVFHMTDLPYGRGGSPLQNLIVRGIKETKLSAIKVSEGIDEGPVYLKMPLGLEGTAEEIYKRASKLIFSEMIPKFLVENLEPIEQVGEPLIFKRRKPEESEIKEDFSLEKIYDYIRMLDADGYPHAFIQFGNYKLEITEGSLKEGYVEAKVVIRKEK